MQLPNNRIPSILIWDLIIDIIKQDNYFCNNTNGILYRKNNNTLAIYDKPLTSVEIVFSDNNLAVGVWHDNSVNIYNRNSLQIDKYTYYIDVASINIDISEAVRSVIKLSREILYTLENNWNLKQEGMLLPNVEIDPTESFDYNDNQILFISTIKLFIETNTMYR
jgi:hypothetical protein